MKHRAQVLYYQQLMIRMRKMVKMIKVLKESLMSQTIHQTRCKFNGNLFLIVLFDKTRGTK